MAPDRLQIIEVDHINLLLASADVAAEHLQRLFGVEVQEVFRQRTGPYDNFIAKVGTMTLEVFAPVDPEYSFGRQHRRFGNCWQGCLWRVPHLPDAVSMLERRGVPMVDVDLARGWAFTDPRATFFSIQLEDKADWDKTLTPNPAGIIGLRGFTVAVEDGPTAVAFFTDLIDDVEVLYEEPRPRLEADAVGLAIAGYELELQFPRGAGALADFLGTYRQRIRSATWQVESLDRVSSHLADKGVELVEGDRSGSLAIRAEDNLGILMQFAS